MNTYKVIVVDKQQGVLLYKTVKTAKEYKALVDAYKLNDSIWVQVDYQRTKQQRYYLGFPCCSSNVATKESSKYYYLGKQVDYLKIQEFTI